MVAVGKDLVLLQQHRTAGVDQIDTRQPVRRRHLLGSQVLLHGHRVVGAARHRRVVGDHHALTSGHPPDAGDHPCRGRLAAVHVLGCQRRDLQERTPGIEKRVDPVTRQQFPAVQVPGPRLLAATLGHAIQSGTQSRHVGFMRCTPPGCGCGRGHRRPPPFS